MEQAAALFVYLTPLAAIVGYYVSSRRKIALQNIDIKLDAISSGLTEPASLHPIIDPLKCIGCGSCVSACPEQQVLGLINRKAELIAPSHCIGHGACKTACPEDAITLVFGTATRGVDIPELSSEFETSQRGVFIAGELGGMGLIRNAIEQGKQAMAAIEKYCQVSVVADDSVYDVVIVGAGPAGIAASLFAIEQNMRYLLLEQDSLGGTVSHFPRGKVVMTSPAKLPLVGTVKFSETSKEELLEFWQQVERNHELKANYQERLENVNREGDCLHVLTNKSVYKSKALLMAIGRRGTPRKLGVMGEELDKVMYRLVDPHQFRHQHVLVVGGGDSAIEAALAISEEEGTTVTLSYRGDSFNRAKEKNRAGIELAGQEEGLSVYLQSEVNSITVSTVELKTVSGIKQLKNSYVIICAGGVLPNALLNDIGISVTTKYGAA
jgi:thioredoxin reductase/Pyruvate/2-oxoacid:ferredoxin oxidoreductase delta subunit